jgi:hypothetical protein
LTQINQSRAGRFDVGGAWFGGLLILALELVQVSLHLRRRSNFDRDIDRDQGIDSRRHFTGTIPKKDSPF